MDGVAARGERRRPGRKIPPPPDVPRKSGLATSLKDGDAGQARQPAPRGGGNHGNDAQLDVLDYASAHRARAEDDDGAEAEAMGQKAGFQLKAISTSTERIAPAIAAAGGRDVVILRVGLVLYPFCLR